MSKDGAVEQQSSRAKVTTVLLRYCATALLFVFIGCGGAQTKALSSFHLKAIEYNQNAAKALENGDYEKALAYYMEALRVNRSIENTGGNSS